jgi:hypothetical protein
MKPQEVEGEQGGGDQGSECNRQAEDEDEMPRVHGIAREPVDPRRDQSNGRVVDAGAAAAEPGAIIAAQSVLEVAPSQQGNTRPVI